MPPNAVETRDLVKSFDSFVAVDHVNLKVGRGEIFGFLGPNGAGKSTLFQILTGLFVADSGDVEVLGVDMRRKPVAALARLGIVFQQMALDLNLSVRANLLFHADLHGLPRSVSKPRIEALLQRFGLLGQQHALARVLSGGNRRKVELLRALLHEPQLLLMDEATVGLDPQSRTQLLDAVVELTHSQNLGVLWATHLVEEAERAQRVVVLHKGKVLFNGSANLLCTQQNCSGLEAAFLQLIAGAR